MEGSSVPVTVAPRIGWNFIRKVGTAGPTHPGCPGPSAPPAHLGPRKALGPPASWHPSSAQMLAGLGRRGKSWGSGMGGNVSGPESLSLEFVLPPRLAPGSCRVSPTPASSSLCPRLAGSKLFQPPAGAGPRSAFQSRRPAAPASAAPPPLPRGPAPGTPPPRAPPTSRAHKAISPPPITLPPGTRLRIFPPRKPTPPFASRGFAPIFRPTALASLTSQSPATLRPVPSAPCPYLPVPDPSLTLYPTLPHPAPALTSRPLPPAPGFLLQSLCLPVKHLARPGPSLTASRFPPPTP